MIVRCQHLASLRRSTERIVKCSTSFSINGGSSGHPATGIQRNFSSSIYNNGPPSLLLRHAQPLALSPFLGLRYMSSTGTDPSRITTVTDVLPELPHIPDVPALPVADPGIVAETLATASDSTLSTLTSLGLGGWTPIGMVQQTLEFFHIGLDLPWWGAIALGTVIVRFLMFPLVIVAQRNAAKMNNHLPQMQAIQLKLTEARQSGNKIEAMRYTQELMAFMKEKNLNPLKSMIVPLAQAPLFISFFIGLRRMANAPVESMATGGALWFLDLTVPDPYYLLPIITSATFYLTIELGTDTARMSSQNMQTMKYVLRAMPLLIIPFTLNFPGAILTYWACSNFVSLGQVGFLKIPKVRKFFKIDQMVVHKQDSLPMKKKGFVEGIKESWTNMKISKELEERQRIDEIRFQKAGKAPLVKTYKYDPTKPRPTSGATIQAKRRAD